MTHGVNSGKKVAHSSRTACPGNQVESVGHVHLEDHKIFTLPIDFNTVSKAVDHFLSPCFAGDPKLKVLDKR